MNSFIKKNFYQLGICLFVLVIGLTNYQSGAFLTGWDNLQTDLSPWLGVKRAIFSVWQENQSFGLLGGMAHGADLLRAVAIWLMSFLVPQFLLRYLFHLFLILTGSLGMFYLLKLSGFKQKKKIFSFLGAVFYLLNFGTVQILTIPVDLYSLMYAGLPWAVWAFFSLLSKKKATAKDWFVFFLVNLAITPQNVSQQVFAAYLLFLASLSLGLFFRQQNKKFIKKIILAFLVIFLVNSFWLLPQLYFLKTSSSVVYQAKANQIHTDNIFDHNLSKGNLYDFLLMRGLHYDLSVGRGEEGLFYLWKNHFNYPLIWPVIFILALLPLFGLVNKNKFQASFISAYLLTCLVLLINVFPFSLINKLLRANSFFNQIFRSPFTKFIVPYSLVASWFFASGLLWLTKKTSSFWKKNFSFPQKLTTGLVFFILIVIYSLPAFKGSYFSPLMKVRIPDDYLDFIQFMEKKDKDKRITILPDYNYWGWFQRRWGYLGSGFLWYGLEQPVVSRTFDVWSLESESYYWQMKKAIESENVEAFEKVLDQYNIDYLLIDYSLTAYGQSQRALQYQRTEKVLQQSTKTSLVKEWSNLALYSFSSSRPVNKFVSLSQPLPNIGPDIKVTNGDLAFQQYGDYQQTSSSSPQVYYPFLDFFSQTRLFDSRWQIREVMSGFIIESQLPAGFKTDQYFLTNLSESENVLWIDDRTMIDYQTDVRVELRTDKVRVYIPKQLVKRVDLADVQLENFRQQGEVDLEKLTDGSLTLKGSDGAYPSLVYHIPFLNQRYGYLAVISNEQIKGRRPFINILDSSKQQIVIEDRLQGDKQYYLLPPHHWYGSGYTFNIFNYSFPNLSVENKISNLEVYFFPYEQIKKIKLQSFQSQGKLLKKEQEKSAGFQVDHPNPSFYQIIIDKDLAKEKTLVLFQSFHPGWLAWQNKPFLGQRIKNHFQINNWANGWQLEKGAKVVYLVFVPQLLQYLGLTGLGLGLVYGLIKASVQAKKKKK